MPKPDNTRGGTQWKIRPCTKCGTPHMAKGGLCESCKNEKWTKVYAAKAGETADSRVCSKCKKPKPLTEYRLKKSGELNKTCNHCRDVINRRNNNETEPIYRLCDYCEHNETCKEFVKLEMPVNCEIEVWEVDWFKLRDVQFAEQLPAMAERE